MICIFTLGSTNHYGKYWQMYCIKIKHLYSYLARIKKNKNYKRYSKAISHVKWNMQCIQISTCLTVGLSLGCSSVVVQPLSRVWLFAIPWMATHTPGSSVLYCLLKFAQICVHWVSDAIQPFHPLLTPSPFSFNISQHPSSSKSVLPIRWPMYWSFSFSISHSNEYSGFISFRNSGRL